MDWLRLWHDMPNDPKWRTIARQAKQPIALVQALYLHLLVAASTNETRGNADVTVEDLASALDVGEDQIQAVLDAMQDRVIDGQSITGWDSRQPKRNDDSKDRVRRYRQKKAEESGDNGGPNGGGGGGSNDQDNAESADVTQCNADVTPRLDESREDKSRDKEIKTCATEAAPDISAEVISYLNEKASRNFRIVPTNTKLILARAKEGATLDDFKAVIDRKCAEWANNPSMCQYLRPATLFNAEKFNQYIGQLGAPLPASTGVVHRLQSVPASREQRIHEQNVEIGRQWAARRRAQGE